MTTETTAQAPALSHDVEPIVRDRLFIGGEWVEPSGSGAFDVIDPATEQPTGRIPAGGPEDVERAVAAARAAFETWSQADPLERADLVRRVGQVLAARAEEIAVLIAREVGMPISLARQIQAGLPLMDFAGLADVVEDLQFEETVGNSLVVREPVGVVACITPWN
jgi:aldehyde dehydrogenase (NAD+)